MTDLATITQDELVRRVKAKLESRPHKPSYSHFRVAPAPAHRAVALPTRSGLFLPLLP
jgi:hypothetical protein